MTPEERIRNKVAGLKQSQMERQSESLRKQYDISVGDNREAFQTEYGGIHTDPVTGRSYHKPGVYKYSDEDLQRAMDMRNSNNRIGNAIFDFVQLQSGNPTLAADAVTAAGFSPGLGTAMGVEDAYQAARDIPDGYREGNYSDMAGNAAQVAMGMGDAALTALPFVKPVLRGARALPKALRNAGEAAVGGMYAVDNLMAPALPANPNPPAFAEIEAYLRKQGK